jgi:hypothetical protein
MKEWNQWCIRTTKVQSSLKRMEGCPVVREQDTSIYDISLWQTGLMVEYCPTGDMLADFFTKPLQGKACIQKLSRYHYEHRSSQ